MGTELETTGYDLLNDKQKKFLISLGGQAKGNLAKAKELAGYSKNTSVAEIIRNLKPFIKDVAEDLLALYSVSSVYSLIDVQEKPGQLGAGNKISAANSILDRAGLIKKEPTELGGGGNNIFILPAKQDINITVDGSKVSLGAPPPTIDITPSHS